MPEYSWLIPPEYEGRKLRSAAVYGMGVSSGLYKRAKFHGEILLDGVPQRADALVHAGQTLLLRVPEKELPPPENGTAPLRVLYEDEYLLAVSKPAPLPVAKSARQTGETLENRVYTYLGCPEDFVYRPVNRLDKGTSGLMLVARDARAQDRLQRLLHSEDFIREYLAVAEGLPPEMEGVISLPIAKEDAASVKRIISPEGRPAVTRYRVERIEGGRSLIRLRLETGRTHQIRVHLQALGCPVCGDFLYGTELPGLPGRFALHSTSLLLRHPITGETLSITDPLPRELEALLENR